jgi:hypothetical protein
MHSFIKGSFNVISWKQTMMSCVEIVNSARERMARLNVPLDLIHSMFFLYFHELLYVSNSASDFLAIK